MFQIGRRRNSAMKIVCACVGGVFGVDAVKGPCAVFIFWALCVLLVIVIVNRLGRVGGGEC